MLIESLGLIGAVIEDNRRRDRWWKITNLFAPIKNRHLGGIRAKLEDQKGFITFCNQRDLELLLHLAEPGDFCPWTDDEYPELESRDFYGLCADPEDLEDDLFDRELQLRALMASSSEYPDVIPYGYQFTRRVHISRGVDAEEVDMMLFDCDPDTGLGPDPRFETLMRRWTKVERSTITWDRA
jgi:hypothetical protein